MPKQGDVFTYDDAFKSGDYTVTITTCYINDTVSDDEAWEGSPWPIVQKQVITFKKMDSTCTVINFTNKQIRKKTKGGKNVMAAEMVIVNAGLIKADHKFLFGIFEANNLCNGSYCPTYTGEFELNGDYVLQYMHNENRQDVVLIGAVPIYMDGDQDSVSTNRAIDSLRKSMGITEEGEKEAIDTAKTIGINKR